LGGKGGGRHGCQARGGDQFTYSSLELQRPSHQEKDLHLRRKEKRVVKVLESVGRGKRRGKKDTYREKGKERGESQGIPKKPKGDGQKKENTNLTPHLAG